MPVPPDALRLGPLHLPLNPTAAVLGWLAAHALAGGRAPRYGLDAAWLRALVWRVPPAAWLAAKLGEVLDSPAAILSSPRLLLAPPAGVWALAGAGVGAALAAWPLLRGRRQDVAVMLDALAVPLLAGLAVGALGVGDRRALPLAAGWLAAAAAVRRLEGRARFPGHVGAAAVVLGALAFVAGDLARPIPGGLAGISLSQMAAAGAALAAYAVARRRAGP